MIIVVSFLSLQLVSQLAEVKVTLTNINPLYRSHLCYFTEGKMYDQEGAEVLPHIQSFIKTYNLPTNELLEQDLSKYPVSPSVISFDLSDSRPSRCPSMT